MYIEARKGQNKLTWCGTKRIRLAQQWQIQKQVIGNCNLNATDNEWVQEWNKKNVHHKYRNYPAPGSSKNSKNKTEQPTNTASDKNHRPQSYIQSHKMQTAEANVGAKNQVCLYKDRTNLLRKRTVACELQYFTRNEWGCGFKWGNHIYLLKSIFSLRSFYLIIFTL